MRAPLFRSPKAIAPHSNTLRRIPILWGYLGFRVLGLMEKLLHYDRAYMEVILDKQR